MKSANRLWLTAILLFWGATLATTLVDFAGVKLFDVTWPSGPDLFPNQMLGIPLAIAQFAAAVVLVIAAWKMATASVTYRTASVRIGLAVVSAVASFVAYVLFGLWYQFEVMHRSM